jgi:hypothetical protein
MTSNRKYYFLISTLFILAVVLKMAVPDEVKWTPNYTRQDKSPLGAYILFDQLETLFPEKSVRISDQPIYLTMDDSLHAVNYLLLNTDFEMDPIELEQMLQFVERGNIAFLSVEGFPATLADTLGFEVGYTPIIAERDTLALNFVNPHLKQTPDFELNEPLMTAYFDEVDTARTTILAQNENKQVNFIRVPHGDGLFYLSSTPVLFSNYGILDEATSGYAFKALSYLPVRDTIWDAYYKAGSVRGAQTPLRFILSRSALKWAYYVALSSVLLFLIFNSRRRQRIIPIIEPLRNTTLDFVTTVGRLYHRYADHKNLAGKKITYFLESLRSQLNLKTNNIDDTFLKTLSELSGVTPENVRKLFTLIDRIQTSSEVTEADLLELHSLIDKFQEKQNGITGTVI